MFSLHPVSANLVCVLGVYVRMLGVYGPDWVWIPKTRSLYLQSSKIAHNRCSVMKKEGMGLLLSEALEWIPRTKLCKAEKELAQKVRVKVKSQYRHHWK